MIFKEAKPVNRLENTRYLKVISLDFTFPYSFCVYFVLCTLEPI